MKKSMNIQSQNNGWTIERRQAQSEKIKIWQPWKSSTGAKTIEGKTKSAQNAYKGGHWLILRNAIKSLNAAMKEQKNKLKQF